MSPIVALFACALVTSVNARLAGRVRARSFNIENDAFVKDGEPIKLRSGSLHYFRVPKAYWRDRMQRMRALGLNSITAYVAWNFHEEVEGNITRLSDVTDFLDIAQSEGFLVILRPGPYICAEWELGGLPAWLLWDNRAGIKLRTYEPQYIAAIGKWLNTLYMSLRSYTYSRGGPVAMIQIENEYGSFGNCAENPDDAKYMNYLLDLAVAHFGTDVVYSTIDGGEGATAADLSAGSPWKGDRRVLGTVDGGLSGASTYGKAFQRQKDFNAPGNSPKMWTELWTGWFTVWGDSLAANKTSVEFRSGLDAMEKQNASFSIYMAHGGTNFGFWSGANGNQEQSYDPDITSYDYSSPISEAGDHNIGQDGGDLFAAIQAAIASADGPPSVMEPAPVPKSAYGPVMLKESADMFANLALLRSCNSMVDKHLPSFENLQHNYGLLLYQSQGMFEGTHLNMTAEIVHDRVQVFVDGQEVGTAYRPHCPTVVSVPAGRRMDLLVENLGRINYGEGIYDYKGYLGKPPVSGSWSAQCLPLQYAQVQALPFAIDSSDGGYGPVFRRGYLQINDTPKDTWLDMQGFTKGYVWVNGENLGRYWETAGPQHTLYLPAPFLHMGRNEVIILDLHRSPAAAVESVSHPRYSRHPQPAIEVF
eukprot:TRINITY_DN91414_c0_g1_i1.p1 TRINITY_DN91414_c0_g1~~TRINITY_DN91414_c0_g1_i1.p1  ORF type:complete len:666 (-),score=75.36 TRINITY_DN91414_c0_g1_i1:451-2388(-)